MKIEHVLYGIAMGLGMVLIMMAIVHSAEPIYYTEWLTFTDDADRERQIDSVGAVCDTIYNKGFEVSIWRTSDLCVISADTSYYAISWREICRQIAFVEIKVWPHYISIQSPMILGKFRVAWKEE